MTTYARTCAWSSLLLLLLIALPLYLRVVMESRLALEHARQARSSDQVAAIAHYRRAISWDAPFGSSAEIAARELYRFASSETLSQELQTTMQQLLETVTILLIFLSKVGREGL